MDVEKLIKMLVRVLEDTDARNVEDLLRQAGITEDHVKRVIKLAIIGLRAA